MNARDIRFSLSGVKRKRPGETEGSTRGSAGKIGFGRQFPLGLGQTVRRLLPEGNGAAPAGESVPKPREQSLAIAASLYNRRVIRVLLFAVLRDAAGRDCFELPAQPGNTARSLWERLLSDFPALDSYTARTRVAVNGKYASWEAEVRSGDEVVFFPPVSGGVW